MCCLENEIVSKQYALCSKQQVAKYNALRSEKWDIKDIET